jgi:hypothetical protein
MIEETIGVKMGDKFWEQSGPSTMGELIDQLLAAIPNYSIKGNSHHFVLSVPLSQALGPKCGTGY